jgi:3,4-dihydroxy 2-butanone 4-phosphate synthase/GTP cyclohydrolase II
MPSVLAPFSTVDDCLADLRAGKMIILTDDEDRENEGDLVLPAQFVTPDTINFMLTTARGYLCLSLTEPDCDRLDLPPQSSQNTSVRGTPFTVSIDGHPRHGFTTGVSARERAMTIKMAIDPKSSPADFVRPGHINPLRSRDGGVLVRTGQTEGSLDLCRLAGLYPAAAIIEIMRDDGEMARVPDLEVLARRHGLKMCSVAQIIEHRLARESLVHRLEPLSGTPIHTAFGPFNLTSFHSVVDPLPHLALTVGGVGDLDARGEILETAQPTLVRMHRRHLLGDVFMDLNSSRAGNEPSGQVLHRAMRLIQQEGRGAIVYLRPTAASEAIDETDASAPNPAGGWGASSAIEQRLQSPRTNASQSATVLSPSTSGSTSAPMREFGIGSQILRQLGLTNLRLLTNSRAELPGLEAFSLRVCERIPI